MAVTAAERAAAQARLRDAQRRGEEQAAMDQHRARVDARNRPFQSARFPEDAMARVHAAAANASPTPNQRDAAEGARNQNLKREMRRAVGKRDGDGDGVLNEAELKRAMRDAKKKQKPPKPAQQQPRNVPLRDSVGNLIGVPGGGGRHFAVPNPNFRPPTPAQVQAQLRRAAAAQRRALRQAAAAQRRAMGRRR